MSRLIDADRLLKRTKFYNLTNENRAIDEIDILHAPTIHAIPLDKVKAAREKMESRLYKGIPEATGFTWQNLGINMCLEILDKLIKESENT